MMPQYGRPTAQDIAHAHGFRSAHYGISYTGPAWMGYGKPWIEPKGIPETGCNTDYDHYYGYDSEPIVDCGIGAGYFYSTVVYPSTTEFLL